jgi:hypothetical protein
MGSFAGGPHLPSSRRAPAGKAAPFGGRTRLRHGRPRATLGFAGTRGVRSRPVRPGSRLGARRRSGTRSPGPLGSRRPSKLSSSTSCGDGGRAPRRFGVSRRAKGLAFVLRLHEKLPGSRRNPTHRPDALSRGSSTASGTEWVGRLAPPEREPPGPVAEPGRSVGFSPSALGSGSGHGPRPGPSPASVLGGPTTHGPQRAGPGETLRASGGMGRRMGVLGRRASGAFGTNPSSGSAGSNRGSSTRLLGTNLGRGTGPTSFVKWSPIVEGGSANFGSHVRTTLTTRPLRGQLVEDLTDYRFERASCVDRNPVVERGRFHKDLPGRRRSVGSAPELVPLDTDLQWSL